MSNSPHTAANGMLHEGVLQGPSQRWTRPTAPAKTLGVALPSDDLSRSSSTPGPGAHAVSESFARPSAPNFSFGYSPSARALREMRATKKTRALAKHGAHTKARQAAAAPATDGSDDLAPLRERARPGPGHYTIPSTLGADGCSIYGRLTPAPSLAGREKFGAITTVDDSAGGPGPAAFALQAPYGPAELPTTRASAKWKFGTAHRGGAGGGASASASSRHAERDAAARDPGPGHYDHSDARDDIGAARATSPSFSLGARPRAGLSYKSLSTEVGPGRCRDDSSLAAQRVSTQVSNPAFSFGHRTHVRGLLYLQAEVPGPGTYGGATGEGVDYEALAARAKAKRDARRAKG